MEPELIRMEIKLTPHQDKAFKYITEGKNVFITGQAGTGKSVIIKTFKNLYSTQKNIAITSTTGISGVIIGGTTLHSFLGIGFGTGSVAKLTTNILRKQYLRKRWKQLDVLIIDEVSMLSPSLFDKLEAIARSVRNNNITFGGIQFVLSGDMCQLPVVWENNFCFEA